MRHKIMKFSIVIFLSGFIIFALFSEQKAEWKGKIKVENGIKVIKNPKEPLYGEIKFGLEEDLSIGREGDDNYMFYSRVSLNVDNQDYIYALDGRSCRIQKYDKNGQYIQTIGRKGQGPGEFELPFKFFIDGRNNIYVNDRRRIKKFNNKGEFVKSSQVRSFILDFYVNSEGNIFAHTMLRDEKGSKKAVVKIDSEGKIVKNIAEYPDVGPIVRKIGDVTYAFGVSHEYIHELCFSSVSEQTFCYAHSSEYQVFILDSNGNLLLKFKKEEFPQSISRKEKNFILDRAKKRFEERGRSLPKGVIEEGYQFPSHRPFFNEIITDDKQRLYVRKLKSVLDKSEGFEFDIFSKEGIYLYKIKLPFIPLVIKNGFVYKVEYNEETGEIKIKRLKVGNWEQIKEGM